MLTRSPSAHKTAFSFILGIVTAVAIRLFESEIADISKTSNEPPPRGWAVAMAIVSCVFTFLPGALVCSSNCRERGSCQKMKAVFQERLQ